MSKDFVSYDTAPATRSFIMRRFVLAATLGLVSLSLAGCKDQQQARKENADQLTGQLLEASADYRRICQTPSDAVSKAAVHDALGSTTPAEQKAHFDQAEKESRARLASPACKELAAKRDAIGTQLEAVMKRGVPK